MADEPKVKGELIITIDDKGTVLLGCNGELSTDEVLLMLVKARLHVEGDIHEKMAMARAMAAHQAGANKIQPGHTLPPGNGPHRRF